MTTPHKACLLGPDGHNLRRCRLLIQAFRPLLVLGVSVGFVSCARPSDTVTPTIVAAIDRFSQVVQTPIPCPTVAQYRSMNPSPPLLISQSIRALGRTEQLHIHTTGLVTLATVGQPTRTMILSPDALSVLEAAFDAALRSPDSSPPHVTADPTQFGEPMSEQLWYTSPQTGATLIIALEGNQMSTLIARLQLMLDLTREQIQQRGCLA
jgi:hypothetical protein